MRKLTSKDLKDLNLLKHYRIIKCKQLISRMYRIMLGEEDIPTSEKFNKVMKRDSYSDKVLAMSIGNVNKDKTR